MCGNMADLMAHNVSTAQKYYKVREKSMTSAKASKQLRHLMCGVSPVAESSEQDSTSITEECQSVFSKQSWTAEKESLVKTLVAKAIKNEVITLELVKAKISNSTDRKSYTPKKVLDKAAVVPIREKNAQQRIEKLVEGEETTVFKECQLQNVLVLIPEKSNLI